MYIPMVGGGLKYPSGNKFPKHWCSARCSSVAAGTTERCRGGRCSQQVVLQYKWCWFVFWCRVASNLLCSRGQPPSPNHNPTVRFRNRPPYSVCERLEIHPGPWARSELQPSPSVLATFPAAVCKHLTRRKDFFGSCIEATAHHGAKAMAAGEVCPAAAEAGGFLVDKEAETGQETRLTICINPFHEHSLSLARLHLLNIPTLPPPKTQPHQLTMSVQMYKPGGRGISPPNHDSVSLLSIVSLYKMMKS